MLDSDMLTFDDAHRRLIASRVPFFALGWLGVSALLILILAVESEIDRTSMIVLLTLQVAVAACVVVLQRGDRTRRWVVPSTVLALAALGLSWLGFFALHGAKAVLAEGLLVALCASAGLVFALGWRIELVLVGLSLGPDAIAGRWLVHLMPPLESALLLSLAALMCLGIAETSKRRLRAARESDERFRLAFARTSVGLAITDREGRPVQINEAICDMLGYERGELMRMSIADVTHPDDQALTREQRQRLLCGEARSVSFEKRFLRKDGAVVWGQVTSSLARDDDGTPRCFVALVQDVTQRRHAMEALQASEEKLRRLALGQAAIREAERKRLGFDLHDDVCQELVGIGILIESARRRIAPGTPGLEELGRGIGYLNEVVEYLRKLARELRPLQLRDLGLEGSLRSLAGGMSSCETEVSVRLTNRIPRLAEETEIAVYRVAQEAITNALRHGRARHVAVSLATVDGALRLEVRDDGLGFDTSAERANLGLLGMKERALALGGNVEVRSRPGEGTTVILCCPVAGSGTSSDGVPPPEVPVRVAQPAHGLRRRGG